MARLIGLVMLALAVVFWLGHAGAGEDPAKSKKFDVDEFFKKLDENMDGKLNKDEFLKLADRAKDKQKARDNLGKFFDKLDPKMKGISREQFKLFLNGINKKKDDKMPPAK